MLVEGLTFDHVSNYGLEFDAQALEARKIIVRNMNVGSGSGNALTLSGYDTLLFRDSLVYACTTNSPGITGTVVYVTATDTSAVIKHVTIANNSGDGLEIFTDTAPASVTDVIAWGNSGYDILAKKYADDSPNPKVSYSDYAVFSAGLDLDATNITTDPLFINPAAENFALKTMIAGWPKDSPAINKGTLSANCPSCVDLSGDPRYVGSRVDMGAYESVVDDRTNIVVTTTADNGSNSTPTTGSLRAAIKNANASAGASKITFGGSLTASRHHDAGDDRRHHARWLDAKHVAQLYESIQREPVRIPRWCRNHPGRVARAVVCIECAAQRDGAADVWFQRRGDQTRRRRQPHHYRQQVRRRVPDSEQRRGKDYR
jgi:hypothetical protein